MATAVILAAVMAGAVVSLLRAIRVQDRIQEVFSKTVASLSFVALGFLRWSAGDGVGGWILAGLVLCALGDVLLLGNKTFDSGLSAFLVGHIFFIAGYQKALPIELWPAAILLPLAMGAGAVIWWLWPHLGRRRLSVVPYVIIMSLMVWGGFSTWWGHRLAWTGALGALLFSLSDLAVARHRFVRPGFVNRAVGLPLYYTGQLLLAVTIGS